jgi:hypothetical protein
VRILICFCLVLSACGSPRNNRVKEGVSTSGVNSHVFSTFNITAEATWLEGPFPEAVNSKLLVSLKDQEGRLLSLDAGKFELGFNAFMPSMGHYLDDPGFFEELSEGIYINSEIKFNMARDWRMDLMILDSNYDVKDKVEWLEIL